MPTLSEQIATAVVEKLNKNSKLTLTAEVLNQATAEVFGDNPDWLVRYRKAVGKNPKFSNNLSNNLREQLKKALPTGWNAKKADACCPSTSSEAKTRLGATIKPGRRINRTGKAIRAGSNQSTKSTRIRKLKGRTTGLNTKSGTVAKSRRANTTARNRRTPITAETVSKRYKNNSKAIAFIKAVAKMARKGRRAITPAEFENTFLRWISKPENIVFFSTYIELCEDNHSTLALVNEIGTKIFTDRNLKGSIKPSIFSGEKRTEAIFRCTKTINEKERKAPQDKRPNIDTAYFHPYLTLRYKLAKEIKGIADPKKKWLKIKAEFNAEELAQLSAQPEQLRALVQGVFITAELLKCPQLKPGTINTIKNKVDSQVSQIIFEQPQEEKTEHAAIKQHLAEQQALVDTIITGDYCLMMKLIALYKPDIFRHNVEDITWEKIASVAFEVLIGWQGYQAGLTEHVKSMLQGPDRAAIAAAIDSELKRFAPINTAAHSNAHKFVEELLGTALAPVPAANSPSAQAAKAEASAYSVTTGIAQFVHLVFMRACYQGIKEAGPKSDSTNLMLQEINENLTKLKKSKLENQPPTIVGEYLHACLEAPTDIKPSEHKAEEIKPHWEQNLSKLISTLGLEVEENQLSQLIAEVTPATGDQAAKLDKGAVTEILFKLLTDRLAARNAKTIATNSLDQNQQAALTAALNASMQRLATYIANKETKAPPTDTNVHVMKTLLEELVHRQINPLPTGEDMGKHRTQIRHATHNYGKSKLLTRLYQDIAYMHLLRWRAKYSEEEKPQFEAQITYSNVLDVPPFKQLFESGATQPPQTITTDALNYAKTKLGTIEKIVDNIKPFNPDTEKYITSEIKRINKLIQENRLSHEDRLTGIFNIQKRIRLLQCDLCISQRGNMISQELSNAFNTTEHSNNSIEPTSEWKPTYKYMPLYASEPITDLLSSFSDLEQKNLTNAHAAVPEKLRPKLELASILQAKRIIEQVRNEPQLARETEMQVLLPMRNEDDAVGQLARLEKIEQILDKFSQEQIVTHLNKHPKQIQTQQRKPKLEEFKAPEETKKPNTSKLPEMDEAPITNIDDLLAHYSKYMPQYLGEIMRQAQLNPSSAIHRYVASKESPLPNLVRELYLYNISQNINKLNKRDNPKTLRVSDLATIKIPTNTFVVGNEWITSNTDPEAKPTLRQQLYQATERFFETPPLSRIECDPNKLYYLEQLVHQQLRDKSLTHDKLTQPDYQAVVMGVVDAFYLEENKSSREASTWFTTVHNPNNIAYKYIHIAEATRLILEDLNLKKTQIKSQLSSVFQQHKEIITGSVHKIEDQYHSDMENARNMVNSALRKKRERQSLETRNNAYNTLIQNIPGIRYTTASQKVARECLFALCYAYDWEMIASKVNVVVESKLFPNNPKQPILTPKKFDEQVIQAVKLELKDNIAANQLIEQQPYLFWLGVAGGLSTTPKAKPEGTREDHLPLTLSTYLVQLHDNLYTHPKLPAAHAYRPQLEPMSGDEKQKSTEVSLSTPAATPPPLSHHKQLAQVRQDAAFDALESAIDDKVAELRSKLNNIHRLSSKELQSLAALIQSQAEEKPPLLIQRDDTIALAKQNFSKNPNHDASMFLYEFSHPFKHNNQQALSDIEDCIRQHPKYQALLDKAVGMQSETATQIMTTKLREIAQDADSITGQKHEAIEIFKQTKKQALLAFEHQPSERINPETAFSAVNSAIKTFINNEAEHLETPDDPAWLIEQITFLVMAHQYLEDENIESKAINIKQTATSIQAALGSQFESPEFTDTIHFYLQQGLQRLDKLKKCFSNEEKLHSQTATEAITLEALKTTTEKLSDLRAQQNPDLNEIQQLEEQAQALKLKTREFIYILQSEAHAYTISTTEKQTLLDNKASVTSLLQSQQHALALLETHKTQRQPLFIELTDRRASEEKTHIRDNDIQKLENRIKEHDEIISKAKSDLEAIAAKLNLWPPKDGEKYAIRDYNTYTAATRSIQQKLDTLKSKQFNFQDYAVNEATHCLDIIQAQTQHLPTLSQRIHQLPAISSLLSRKASAPSQKADLSQDMQGIDPETKSIFMQIDSALKVTESAQPELKSLEADTRPFEKLKPVVADAQDQLPQPLKDLLELSETTATHTYSDKQIANLANKTNTDAELIFDRLNDTVCAILIDAPQGRSTARGLASFKMLVERLAANYTKEDLPEAIQQYLTKPPKTTDAIPPELEKLNAQLISMRTTIDSMVDIRQVFQASTTLHEFISFDRQLTSEYEAAYNQYQAWAEQYIIEKASTDPSGSEQLDKIFKEQKEPEQYILELYNTHYDKCDELTKIQAELILHGARLMDLFSTWQQRASLSKTLAHFVPTQPDIITPNAFKSEADFIQHLCQHKQAVELAKQKYQEYKIIFDSLKSNQQHFIRHGLTPSLFEGAPEVQNLVTIHNQTFLRGVDIAPDKFPDQKQIERYYYSPEESSDSHFEQIENLLVKSNQEFKSINLSEKSNLSDKQLAPHLKFIGMLKHIRQVVNAASLSELQLNKLYSILKGTDYYHSRFLVWSPTPSEAKSKDTNELLNSYLDHLIRKFEHEFFQVSIHLQQRQQQEETSVDQEEKSNAIPALDPKSDYINRLALVVFANREYPITSVDNDTTLESKSTSMGFVPSTPGTDFDAHTRFTELAEYCVDTFEQELTEHREVECLHDDIIQLIHQLRGEDTIKGLANDLCHRISSNLSSQT